MFNSNAKIYLYNSERRSDHLYCPRTQIHSIILPVIIVLSHYVPIDVVALPSRNQTEKTKSIVKNIVQISYLIEIIEKELKYKYLLAILNGGVTTH